jgi:hypothetical protein
MYGCRPYRAGDTTFVPIWVQLSVNTPSRQQIKVDLTSNEWLLSFLGPTLMCVKPRARAPAPSSLTERKVIHLCSVLRCLIFAGQRRIEATIYPVAQVAQLRPLRET